MDLTEKIARAICEADGLDPDEVSQVLQPVHKRLQNWRGYTSHAVAAIEALAAADMPPSAEEPAFMQVATEPKADWVPSGPAPSTR